MMKLLFFSLLFVLTSCIKSEVKSTKLKKEDYVKIESIVKVDRINRLRATIDIYRDSINLNLRLSFLPITVANIKLDNQNIFINHVGHVKDTIHINSISSNFKTHRLHRLLLKKKNPRNSVNYSNQSFFISLLDYVKINNLYAPQSIIYSSEPFKDTLKLELDYKSIVFR